MEVGAAARFLRRHVVAAVDVCRVNKIVAQMRDVLEKQFLVAKRDVAAIEPQNFSMMPEGLVLTFSDQELRDLISYLRGQGQVPLPGGKAAE